MTRSTPTRVATAAAALLSLTLAAGPASAVVAAPSPFSALYVFGDSLSDAAGGSLSPVAPNEGGFPIPAPYDSGRVSNGPVAAEYLGGLLGLSDAQQFHFAVAGARSGATGSDGTSTGLLTQVGAFALPGANADYNSGALFMVWAGANDLRDAFQERAVNGTDPFESFAGIISNLQSAVSTLWGLGARHFLLPNIPNLGLTPAAQAQPVPGAVSFVTMLFNDQLALAFGALAGNLPGAHLYTFDTFAAHTQLFMSGSYTNLSNGCLVPVAGAADAQSPCDVSFYVDDIHPTTSVHQILGQQMAAAVPEPGAMLLMATGALTLLGLQRRRQRTAA